MRQFFIGLRNTTCVLSWSFRNSIYFLECESDSESELGIGLGLSISAIYMVIIIIIFCLIRSSLGSRQLLLKPAPDLNPLWI